MRYIIRIIISILLSFSVSDTIREILNYDTVSSGILFLICTVSMLLIYFILYNNKTLKFTGIFIIFTLSISSVILYLIELLGYVFNNIISYFSLIYKSIQGYVFVQDNLFHITIILIVMLINFFLYFLLVKQRKYLIVSTIIVVFYAILSIIEEPFSLIDLYICILAILLMYFKNYFDKNNSIKSYRIKYIIFSIPALTVFILILLSSSIYFSHIKPDALSFVDDIVDAIQSIEFGSSKDSDSIQRTITYDTDVANSVNHSSFEDTTIMIVNSPDNYHLRSQTYNKYNGTNWTNDVPTYTQHQVISEEAFQTAEMMQNIYGYHYLLNGTINHEILSFEDLSNYANEYFYNREINIDYRNVKTNTIFAPRNVYQVNFNDINIYSDQTNVLFTNSTLSDGFEVSYKFYSPKKDTAEFRELLRKSYEGYYRDHSFSQFYGYNDHVYNYYTFVPKDIPNRVSRLANEIAKHYDNNYDKVKAIEQYISREYEYTLEPKPFNENLDFVDSFLFETKEGYCTYYASAMVIMVRALGIPSRYVRGYVLPKKERDIIDEMMYRFGSSYDPNRYVVREENSHAWPEVYFEGYGWVAFEPTKVYYDDFNTEIIELDFDPQKVAKDASSSAFDKAWPIIKLILQILSGLLVITLILSPFIYRKKKIKEYEKLSNSDKSINTFYKILNLFELINEPITENETPLSYAKRMEGKYYLSRISFENIVLLFYKARYGNKKIDVFELNAIESFYDDAKVEVLSYANKLKTAFYYLTNKIK